MVCMYGLCEKGELTPASLFGKIWVVSLNLIVIFLTAAAHTTKKHINSLIYMNKRVSLK